MDETSEGELMETKEKQLGGCTGKGWLPGQSGNPNGRPPHKRYLSEIVREMLQEVRKGDVDNKTNDELVVMALFEKALVGDTKAIEMIHDWSEGKVTDSHKFEGDIPVSIVYKPTDAKDD